MSEHPTEPKDGDKPANIAPDAVKDPNEKIKGKPGLGGRDDWSRKVGEVRPGEIDPGGG